MRILEQIPELALCRGTEPITKVFLLVPLLLCSGQEPSGSVVSVLTAGLHVEIIETPVLQLLTEVLNTNLDDGGIGQLSCEGLNWFEAFI